MNLVRSVFALISMLTVVGYASAQGTGNAVLKPQFLPPAELELMLGARDVGGRSMIEWSSAGASHAVSVRRNDASNMLLLQGSSEDIATILAQAQTFDVAPRQIAIEAKIVEVDQDKARDLGIDWSTLQTSASGRISSSGRTDRQRIEDPGFKQEHTNTVTTTATDLSGFAQLNKVLQLLDENGAATVRDAPRILTLNNRSATILDGQRVTYVTRYSSYSNLFATDSMDAGLRLQVLPSVGESGYLRLDLRAELTSLSSNISGSPVKDGQIVENTVVVKDGESVLLGGFTRTLDRTQHRRFPVLGYVLPFLFSRDIHELSRHESFVVITPHVVDLNTALDETTRKAVEGH